MSRGRPRVRRSLLLFAIFATSSVQAAEVLLVRSNSPPHRALLFNQAILGDETAFGQSADVITAEGEWAEEAERAMANRWPGSSRARIVQSILAGKSPGDIPIQAPEGTLAINLRAASLAGVDVPPKLLSQPNLEQVDK